MNRIEAALPPGIVREGEQLLKQGGPKEQKIRESGSKRVIRTKWQDRFNFVDTSVVTVDVETGAVLSVSCTCGQNKGLCMHTAAVLLSLDSSAFAVEGETASEEAAAEESASESAPEGTVEDEHITQAELETAIDKYLALRGNIGDDIEVNDSEDAYGSVNPITAIDPAEDTAAENDLCENIAEENQVERRSMEILFGHDTNGEEVLWRPNDTEQVFHTNTGIIGTMGTGKTQFTKSLVTQLVQQTKNNYDGSSLGILIFDYKGDYNETKEDFVEATKAKVLKPFRLPYNPLALHQTKAFKPLLPMHVANIFKDTISQIYNLGPKQQQNLLDCLIEAYERQGIHPADPASWKRKAPTFEQVYTVYSERFGSKTPDSLTAAMNKLHQFCIFSEDPGKVYPLTSILKGVVVIDLSGYTEDIQNLVVAITLDLFYAQMQQLGSGKTDGKLRQLRTMILVDEADNFMRQKFPSLRKIMKEGREFGVGILLSTQSLTHFYGEDDYSRYILTWVVHNVNDLKQKDVEYIFRMQAKSTGLQSCYEEIKALDKHQSLVKIANAEPIRIRDRAFWQLLRDAGDQPAS